MNQSKTFLAKLNSVGTKFKKNFLLTIKNKFFLLFLIAFIALIAYLSVAYNKILHSDICSEFVLGQILARENRLITSHNWWYSSEIRIINNQIIYGLLFRMTSNYRVVFALSQFIILSLYLSSFYLLLRSMKLKEYFYPLSIVLLIPWPQTQYFTIALREQFYIPHIMFSFLTTSSFFFFINSHSKLNKIIYALIGSCLAFLNALEGGRGIAVLSIPLFCCVFFFFFFNKKKDRVMFALLMIIFSATGYLINSMYLVQTYELIFKPKLVFSLDNIVSTLKITISAIGLDSSILSIILFLFTVFFILSLFYFVIKFKFEFSEHEKYISIFILLSFSCVFAMFCCTSLSKTTRYYLMSTVFLIVLMPRYLKCWNKMLFNCGFKSNKHHNSMFAIAFSSLMIYTSIYQYSSFYPLFKKELIDICNYIVQKTTLRKGYSSFWISNAIIQYSNAEVDMYTYDTNYKSKTGLKIKKWLQHKSHLDFKISGGTFFVFAPSEIGHNSSQYALFEDVQKIVGETSTVTKHIKFNNYRLYIIDDVSPLFK